MNQNNVIQFPGRKAQPPSDAPASTNQHPAEPPALVFNIYDYLPTSKKVEILESDKGVLFIPHQFLEFAVKATDTHVELVVYTCLIRYSLGFHRATCKASFSFIVEWTGLATASVRRGLKGLLSKNLIKCLNVGKHVGDSSIYEVPLIKGYRAHLSAQDSAVGIFTSVMENSDVETSPELCRQKAQNCAQNERNYSQNEHRTMPTGGTKKENTNQQQENKHTNSDTDAFQKYLDAYFSGIQSEKKRVKELENFKSLKKSRTLEEIANSLKYLLKNGLPGSGEKCWFPMAFLACSIDAVLPYLEAEKNQALKKQVLNDKEEEKKKKLAAEAEEDRLFQEKIKRFENAFPTQELQESFIQEIAIQFPLLAKNRLTLRNFAISKWNPETSSI